MFDIKHLLEGIFWGASGTLTVIALLVRVNSPFKKWWNTRFITPQSIRDRRLDKLELQIVEIQLSIENICKQNMGKLHHSIYKECLCHIERGFISKSDLDNLVCLYEPYYNNKGNGICEKLMIRVLALPIKKESEIDNE